MRTFNVSSWCLLKAHRWAAPSVATTGTLDRALVAFTPDSTSEPGARIRKATRCAEIESHDSHTIRSQSPTGYNSPNSTTSSARFLAGDGDRAIIIRIHGQEFNSFRRKTRSKALHEFKLHRQESSSRLRNPALASPSRSMIVRTSRRNARAGRASRPRGLPKVSLRLGLVLGELLSFVYTCRYKAALLESARPWRRK